MKTAIYQRVSTAGQTIDSQAEAITRYCEGHNITPMATFTDKATGSNVNRKAFDDLQTAIFNGEIDCVIIYKLDRLSRSLRDGINILADWLEKGVRVISVSQQFDFSGSTGKLIASVLFGVAEMELELRKERQKEGISAAQKKGIYAKHGRKKGDNLYNHNRIIELQEQGHTKTEIANAICCNRQTVWRVLKGVSA
jgi:DNA invertase Pin-like site-specific DNA recombinase